MKKILAAIILTTGLLTSSSAYAETADEAMDKIITAGPLDLPPAPEAPIGVEVRAVDAPAPATVPAAPANVTAVLDPATLEAKGYSLVPAPELYPKTNGPTFGERLARMCSEPGHISFDCVESPAIALLNIADENRTKSPATYWIVGTMGMILGAILFLPALAIALVSGGANLIHDIATGS